MRFGKSQLDEERQPLDERGIESLTEGDFPDPAISEGERQRRHLGVEGRIHVNASDRGGEADGDPLARIERGHHREPAVAEHSRWHRELVEQRVDGVAEAERWHCAVARPVHGADQAVHFGHGLEIARRAHGEHVQDPGSRADAEDRHAAAPLEGGGQRKLAPGHVEQAAQIDVVGASLECALHRAEVEAVRQRGDRGPGARERPPQARAVRDVARHRPHTRDAVRPPVAVRDHDLRAAAARSREVAGGDPPHGAGSTQDHDAGLHGSGGVRETGFEHS